MIFKGEPVTQVLAEEECNQISEGEVAALVLALVEGVGQDTGRLLPHELRLAVPVLGTCPWPDMLHLILSLLLIVRSVSSEFVLQLSSGAYQLSSCSDFGAATAVSSDASIILRCSNEHRGFVTSSFAPAAQQQWIVLLKFDLPADSLEPAIQPCSISSFLPPRAFVVVCDERAVRSLRHPAIAGVVEYHPAFKFSQDHFAL